MVIRGGGGIFYNRFSEGQTLTANRFNGLNQLQFVITDPAVLLGRPPTAAEQAANPSFGVLNTYPVVPSVAGFPATQQTIYRVSPNLQAPQVYLTGLQVERQLPKNITAVVGVYTMRMIHGVRLRDVNAPLPPTFTARPTTGVGDVYQYESSGKFRQSQMFIGFNSRLNPRISLSGNYVLSKSTGDFDGFGGSGLPMNSYDLSGEYGRTSGDVRHRFTLFGTVNSPWWGLVFNPFVVLNTGRPFNITTGQDLNLDRAFNERPTFAQLNAYCTANPSRCDRFDFSNTSDEIIPRNFGNGPGSVSVNLRVSRTFTWGGESARRASSSGSRDNQRGGGGGRGPGGPSIGGSIPGGGSRGPGGGAPAVMMGGPGGGGAAGRYSLTFSINVQNVLNHVNLGDPVGILTSSNFGQSLSLGGGFGGFGGPGGFGGGGGGGAGNRRITLNMRFNF
jgi:hypothetical protein